MSRTTISTERAPRALGHYAQAISTECQGLVFCAGQIALDPRGELVPGDIRAQTRQVLENLAAVLEAAGSSLDRVVKTTVFLVDIGEFGAFNEVYGGYFPNEPPARATVQVAALPRGARVEIDAIATAG
jgi:2-iminobutanoate/2-iminopropanoate deaminase